MVEALSRFCRWWFAELSAMVPSLVKSFFLSDAGRFIMRLSTSELRVLRKRRAEEDVLASLSLQESSDGELVDQLARQLARNVRTRDPLPLLLDEDTLLRRRIELPIEAAENLQEVVAFEMDRHTPFQASEVYFKARVLGADADLKRLNVEVAVAKRSDVDRARRLIEEAGFHCGRVSLAPQADEEEGTLLLADETNGRRFRFMPVVAVLLLLLVLVLGAFSLYLPIERAEKALAASEDELLRLRTVARKVSDLEERFEKSAARALSIQSKKEDGLTTVALLNEVSERLPDDSWLLQLGLREGTLRMVGFSSQPTKLLRLFEQSPFLTEVRFAAPVTHDARVGKDRFNLTAKVIAGGASQ